MQWEQLEGAQCAPEELEAAPGAHLLAHRGQLGPQRWQREIRLRHLLHTGITWLGSVSVHSFP